MLVALAEDADLVPCGVSPPVLLGNLAPSSGLLYTCRENLKHTEVNQATLRKGPETTEENPGWLLTSTSGLHMHTPIVHKYVCSTHKNGEKHVTETNGKENQVL